MQAMRSSLSGYFHIWINTKMQLLYIHDKGLGDNQPIFSRMTPNSRALFIWDDAYFKKRNYSLKRLVFIYETLISMPVEIVLGETSEIVNDLAPKKIITTYTADIELRRLMSETFKDFELELVYPKAFVHINDEFNFTRFFKYWNKAKKTAFHSETK